MYLGIILVPNCTSMPNFNFGNLYFCAIAWSKTALSPTQRLCHPL